jgi:hypothetical protein
MVCEGAARDVAVDGTRCPPGPHLTSVPLPTQARHGYCWSPWPDVSGGELVVPLWSCASCDCFIGVSAPVGEPSVCDAFGGISNLPGLPSRLSLKEYPLEVPVAVGLAVGGSSITPNGGWSSQDWMGRQTAS